MVTGTTEWDYGSSWSALNGIDPYLAFFKRTISSQKFPMIDIKCRCGETYHADDSHVGGSIRCGKCGTINRIERISPVQSMYQSRTEPIPLTSTEGRPIGRVRRSPYSHSRRMKAAIVAAVLLGVSGIAVALSRLWPDSPRKIGAESSSSLVTPSLTTQPYDIQLPSVEPTPPIPNPWRQSGNLPPAPSGPDNLASFPTANTEAPANSYSPMRAGSGGESA